MVKQPSDLRSTPLLGLHIALDARLVPFAGFTMPVQYPTGTIAEHGHTRSAAGLFDVSHMGQVFLSAPGDPGAVLERLVPGDVKGLEAGQMRYTLLLNDKGGIVDDLLVGRLPQGDDRYFAVLNAARREADIAHIRARTGEALTVEPADDRALLALQGPLAAAVLGRFIPGLDALTFMRITWAEVLGARCLVSRTGYTGEDGFEISVPAGHADRLARALLDQAEVQAVGLAARDTLRLEAGLCLHGQDIDEETTPIEAGLAWTIPRWRRQEGGFVGFATVENQLRDGVDRHRVGLRLEGRQPVRQGADITDLDGRIVGHVTSGGFGPTVGVPIAMGYVATEARAENTPLLIRVRGRSLMARVVKMPFIETHYYRG